MMMRTERTEQMEVVDKQRIGGEKKNRREEEEEEEEADMGQMRTTRVETEIEETDLIEEEETQMIDGIGAMDIHVI